MMRRLLLLLLSLMFITVTMPATAAPGPVRYITICNHDQSVDNILVYNNTTGYRAQVVIGNCRANVDDYGGDARVDVDIGGTGGDVDSWEKGNLTYTSPGSWTCYNNEDESSNPYYGATTLYHTYSHTGC